MGGRAGTRVEAHGELVDDRVIRGQTRALLIGCAPQFGEVSLIVRKHQLMAVLAVLVVPRNPVFTAQPLDELEVVFTILGTVFALRAGADIEGIGVGLDAMAAEYLGDDVWHRQVLEDPWIVTELQIVQVRYQGQVVAGQALASFTHVNIFDSPMNTLAIEAKLQKSWLAEQAFKIEIRVLADQLNLDRIQAADGFSALEGQYLEVVTNRGDQYREVRSIGRCEHTLILKLREEAQRNAQTMLSLNTLRRAVHANKAAKELM